MNNILTELLKEKRKRSRYLALMLVLAVLVTAGVAGLFHLPAVAKTYQKTGLTCTAEAPAGPGYAGFFVHTHNEDCFDENGELWCPLLEIEAHLHDESCYTTAAVQVCKLPESGGHRHTEACYTLVRGDLICKESTEPVYNADGAIIAEGHVHTDECFAWNEELSCGMKEGDGAHHHDNSCYEYVTTLTCEKPEVILHVHTEDCYQKDEDGSIYLDEDGNTRLICGMQEVTEHIHGPECFMTIELDDGEPEFFFMEENKQTDENGNQDAETGDETAADENTSDDKEADHNASETDPQTDEGSETGGVSTDADSISTDADGVNTDNADPNTDEENPDITAGEKTRSVVYTGTRGAEMGGMTVLAEIPEGALDENAKLVLADSDDNAAQQLILKVINENAAEGEEREITSMLLLDIGFVSGGEPVVLKGMDPIRITLRAAAIRGMNAPRLYHLTDGIAQEVKDVLFDTEAGTAVFTNTTFSPFAVVDLTGKDPAEETAEETVGDSMPAQDFHGTTDEIEVFVNAPEGAFPAGTTMWVTTVPQEEVIDALNDAANGVMVRNVQAVDITFRNSENVEIEPLLPISVKMSRIAREQPAATETAPEAKESVVLHVETDGSAQIVENANVTDTEAEFESDSFSTYIMADLITEEYIASNGHNYRISVTYRADAGIPENAGLSVEEITESSSAYEAYVANTENALGMEEGSAGYIRLFEISIVDKDDPDIQYQPAPGTTVDVRIELADAQDNSLSVVHFADENDSGSLVDADASVQEVIFEASGFSVYAIVGDTNAKYVFHDTNGSEYSFLNKNGDSTTFQHVPVGGTLYNPGTPEIPEGSNLLFMGWWTKNGENWGERVIPANAETVKPDLSGLTEGECTVINLYPRFEETYYLVYHDETMTNILATETVTSNQNVTLKDDHGDLRVQCILSGEQATQKAVLGWANEPRKTTDEDVLEDPFSFDGGTLELYPVIADAYWISFDKNDWKYTENTGHTGAYDLVNGVYVPNENGTGAYDRSGTGASYVAPRFVLTGENYADRYNDDIPVSERPGYSFQGWYYDQALTQPFDPNAAPTENITVYGKWKAETTPYTVQYWLQKPNGEGYELADVELKLWEGTTGTQTAVTADALTKKVNDQGEVVDGPAVKDKYAHYKLHAANPADDYTIVNTEILGDESTVVNVYYDCQTYTLRFIYARSSASSSTTYSYDPITAEEAAATGNTVYGLVNGSYIALTRGSDGSWSYSEQMNYTGNRYRARTNDTNGTRYGFINGSMQQIYYRNGNWRTSNNNNATVYTGTVYQQGTGDDYLYGVANGEVVSLTRSRTTYTYTTDGTYTGQLYSRTASNQQYQITEDVSAFTTNSYSTSWNGIQDYSSGSFGMNWQNVTGKPPVTMKDGYELGSFTHGNYTYYYVDVTGLKYGQDISGVWPYNSLQAVGKSNSTNNYGFVSWGVQYGSPYWDSKYDEWRASSATNKNGLFTIKGAYNNLDDRILNDVNNATELPNGDLLAHVLFGRYKTTWNEYDYHIFVDLLDGQTGTRTYNGESYLEYKVVEDVTSTATLQEQAELAFEGLEYIAGPFNNNNQATQATGGDVYYYYKRVEYDLNIFRNHEGDTYTEEGATYSTQKVKFGQDITGYLENNSKNHLLNYSDYVVGETRYTAESGEEFVFTGWYTNPEGLGDPVDFTNVEMTENKFIYAGWRPIRYRAWIQPNGGVLSTSESTWFNLDYGETVGNYSDITRDYLRDNTGEYIYVIYDHEDPRTAQYVKLSEATDDQKVHALKDGSNYIMYKYLKNAYTFVGWYEVLNEEFGTYEQYYANGNSNDGEFTVRPPTINESDTLSVSTYIFGTPVTYDIALRAIWKRAGTISIQFDPKMAGTELSGTVPEEYAAKETEGDHAGEYILSYDDTGKPDQWSANPDEEERIYPLTEQVYADLSNEKATYAPTPPENYYFVGWKTPYGTIVEPNDIFTLYVDLAELMGEGADGEPWYRYTLTAVYASLDDVDLTYDANGGTGTLTDYGSQEGNESFTGDSNKVFDLILNNPVVLSDGSGFTREGYVLVGWSKESGDNNPLDYALGDDNVFVDDENSTLYAVWRQMILDVNVYKYGQQQSGADAPLPGAGFKLTKIVGSTSTESTTTSESDGLVQFENVVLPADATLKLNETSVPDGTEYQLITADITITYEAVTNQETRDYVFKTVDEVEYISAVVTDITCSNSGVITSEDINQDGTNEWVIHNKINTVPIRIVKTDDFGAPLGGAEFSLVGGTLNLTGLVSDADNQGIVTQTIDTGDSATTVTQFDLELDTGYTLTETGPLSYYDGLAGQVTLTPSASGISLTFEDETDSSLVTLSDSPDPDGVYNVTVKNIKQYLVSVWKTGLEHNTLTGASFALYQSEDYAENGTSAEPIVSPAPVNTSGILSLGYLPVGTYSLVEIQAPAGYNPIESAISITVQSDKNKPVSGMQGTQPTEVTHKGDQYWVDGQDDATWQVRVWNNPGVELPSTGGSGTALFTAIGGILTATAGAILTLASYRRKKRQTA